MILTTKRLLLREFVEDDWHAVLAYQSDPRYFRYYSFTQRSAEDAQAFVHRFISWQKERPRTRFQLAVTLPAEGRLIGSCGVRMVANDAVEAELGYEFDPSFWGQGYATEAARTMAAYGFKQLELHRIWAACLAENIASVRVLEKIGMKPEGRLRENRWMKNRWWDMLVYGLLESEL